MLDGVTDPHNLGACLRVADGAGVHCVIAPKDHAAGINATVAKVASGAAETVPYFMVTNLARTLNEFKERAILVVGTSDAAPQTLYQADLRPALALVLAACGGGSNVADGDIGSAQASLSSGTGNVSTPSSGTGTTALAAGTPSNSPITEALGPALVPSPALGAVAQQLDFSFDLPSARTTSAGVFTVGGHLIRTLWRGERLAAGRHHRNWDHRLDNGQAAAEGSYSVRLIHHDVKYQWDGVVGNTSAAAGRTPHRSFLPPMSLAADGAQLHIGLGYNEAQAVLTGLRVDDPQRPAPQVSHADPFIGAGLVASDGQQLFVAHTGGIHRGSFIFAMKLTDGQKVDFSQGQSLCLNTWPNSTACYPDQNYRSVFASRAPGEPQPTGLAVQRQGHLLAVA